MSINFRPVKHKYGAGLMPVLFILMIGLLNNSATAAEANPHNSKQVERGQVIYQKFCAVCHGENLEGQANWRIRNADGKLPAPPHDETGHTWHHPDRVLFDIVKNGLVPLHAPANYETDMPAWGSVLNDGDIWAVLAYIKSRWPAKAQAIQAKMNN